MTGTTDNLGAEGRAGQGAERGASVIEYALLIALIATVCAVAVQFFGGTMSESFSSNGSQLFPS
jgi:Flp pilus assembly pilin Flp